MTGLLVASLTLNVALVAYVAFLIRQVIKARQGIEQFQHNVADFAERTIADKDG